jgi:TM2 domain-containing membrane protein YozV
MRKFLSIYFLIPLSVLSQSTSFDFHSPANIKKFADHLFCESDYLRAAEQYELIDNNLSNDTITFKRMVCYSNLELYQQSNNIFTELSDRSKFFNYAYLLSLKNNLLIKQQPLITSKVVVLDSLHFQNLNKLTTISMLYDPQFDIAKEEFLSSFDFSEQNTVSLFYDYKVEPPYKSPAIAGVLSAIIPGSGKMYIGEWGDGITAFLVTGLFAFLAYDNFRADHTTRAWIFTGLGAFFYAGNIYGSIASAQIFNARIDFEFNDGLKLFLEKKNYFLPEYDFCK